MKTLSEKRQDMTRGLILDAAFELLREGAVSELTVRAVAQHAVISERTVFRYFPSREALLDAVAAWLLERMAIPAVPESREGLLGAPRLLYQAFEDRADTTRAALHPELIGRIRALQANGRWEAVSRLLAAIAPKAGAAEQRIAAANICYHLTASSWNYYRSAFGFELEECIACAEAAVRQALDGIGGVKRK
ncbi:helix-turn-helix domain-containing protein [Massilia sp. IC2-476]|uniref:helix-turn-helix domain-containing protein n=1 Tax=Massilia sp. IC2-476 TaxID=2887199 RepID=UPI001D115FFA|nr:TetR/AcrR family transcriptional regulator [Massilia sp. IC2-476]MCC2970710.1 TetR/AcrR family transcriptional regulator [Massilia sp. IC2-476]